MTANVTPNDVKLMNGTQLRELGSSLGLRAISRTPKPVLQQMILDELELQEVSHEIQTVNTPSAPEVCEGFPQQVVQEVPEEVSEEVSEEVVEKISRPKRTLEVYISDVHRQILDNENFSKSEKMRRLWKNKMSIADIHRVLDSHYSFTYGVIDRYRKLLEK